MAAYVRYWERGWKAVVEPQYADWLIREWIPLKAGHIYMFYYHHQEGDVFIRVCRSAGLRRKRLFPRRVGHDQRENRQHFGADPDKRADSGLLFYFFLNFFNMARYGVSLGGGVHSLSTLVVASVVRQWKYKIGIERLWLHPFWNGEPPDNEIETLRTNSFWRWNSQWGQTPHLVGQPMVYLHHEQNCITYSILTQSRAFAAAEHDITHHVYNILYCIYCTMKAH